MFPMKSVDLAKTPAAQVALHLYNMKLPANLLQRMKKEASFFYGRARPAGGALAQLSNLTRFSTQYECPSK